MVLSLAVFILMALKKVVREPDLMDELLDPRLLSLCTGPR
jgi:hypothetical protein